ncbi:MAG: glutaminyl-peptide cyclotransferase [Cytophagales bacterium]|nr:glutaminyl-peptide cyclotransferase [Cytophagales bacterium]
MRPFYLVLLTLLFCAGCGKQNSDSPESPRIKSVKLTKVISPKINQVVTIGDEVLFEVESGELKIDSINIRVGDYSQTFNSESFNWIPSTEKTGIFKVQLTAFCNGKEETHYPRIKLLSDIEPEQYSYIVMGAYPHDTQDYTQGLFFLDNQLVESTGQEEKSELKKTNPMTGQTIMKVPLDNQYFGEGCTLYNNEIYQLTWNSKTGFVYDLELNMKRTFQYNTEGWGLTTIGDSLVMSDGSNKLYFMTPGDFSEIDRLEVYNHLGAVDNLNELEYINGLIYANQYNTNLIHAIEPSSGRILKTIDLTGLLTEEEARAADVLNGIAYEKRKDQLYVTGKWWPWLFEIKLKPKNPNL